MFNLSQEALEFNSLELSAKKLLYSCQVEIINKGQRIFAHGKVRFGPIAGNIEIETQFNDDGSFSLYHIQLPQIKFWQKYQMIDGRLYFTRSKDQQERTVDTQGRPWLDPLCLLLQFRHDFLNSEIKSEYVTFSKNKLSSLFCEKTSKGWLISRKDTPLFEVVHANGDDLKLTIHKIGIDVFFKKIIKIGRF